jgi:hypothetical protein
MQGPLPPRRLRRAVVIVVAAEQLARAHAGLPAGADQDSDHVLDPDLRTLPTPQLFPWHVSNRCATRATYRGSRCRTS